MASTQRAAATEVAAPRPKVAICVAGNARTFANPAVHETLKRNLAEAFGGDASFFLRLKAQDRGWKVRCPSDS